MRGHSLDTCPSLQYIFCDSCSLCLSCRQLCDAGPWEHPWHLWSPPHTLCHMAVHTQHAPLLSEQPQLICQPLRVGIPTHSPQSRPGLHSPAQSCGIAELEPRPPTHPQPCSGSVWTCCECHMCVACNAVCSVDGERSLAERMTTSSV